MGKFFNIKLISTTENALKNVGFDSSYLNQGIRKHIFKSVKISGLSCAQANILKQTAISVGTDCAVHREVITGKVEISDCILSGSLNQMYKIAKKLSNQPFNLKKLGEDLLSDLDENIPSLITNDIVFDWKAPLIMGILNVTPDSFSDGGMHDSVENALSHFRDMVEFGADIVDIGGESTRPYAEAVSVNDEIQRVIPVVKAIRKFDKKTILSIDTRNSDTADLALSYGVNIINDVSALNWDSKMISVLKKYSCPVIVTHSSDSPEKMQDKTDYVDVVDEIYDFLKLKISYLVDNGISPNNIIIDPGIGFGKTVEQNIEIINRINEFKSLGHPILVGHSRKSFLNRVVNTSDKNSLDDLTVMLSQTLLKKGVNILRVHNVEKHKLLLDLIKYII